MTEFIDGDPFDPKDELHKSVTVKTLHEQESERTIAYLRGRKEAYARVFAGSASAEDIERVKKDLAAFCRAELSTYHTDARDHARLEGRREVWLRIMAHVNLSVDELYTMYVEGKNVT